MAFPRLKSKKYSLVLPVAKREIEYRPYTVAEENPLLEARATQNEAEYVRALLAVVKECTEGKVNPEVDSYIDVIQTFIMIRAKSVNEVSEFTMPCNCDEEEPGEIPVKVDITTDLKIDFPNQSNVVEIDNDGQIVQLHMRPLPFNSFIKSSEIENTILGDLAIFKACLVKIVEGEESYDFDTATDEEWENFFLTIPKNVYVQIEKYLANQPTVYLEANGVCNKCGKQHTRKIEGTKNFI